MKKLFAFFSALLATIALAVSNYSGTVDIGMRDEDKDLKK